MRRSRVAAVLAVFLVASALPAIAAEPSGPNTLATAAPSSEPSADPSGPPAGPDQVPPLDGTLDTTDDATLDVTGRFIVVLKPGADVARVREVHARQNGVRADREFSAFRGFSAKLDVQQRAGLLGDPDVLAIVPDEVIHLASQVVPTGIRRIGARSAEPLDVSGSDGVDADIAIVDTGIDATHPDLNVQGGINCSSSATTAWRDVHGHGTHVAGIAAARDDNAGVVGVAPGARLWAVKILNDTGNGLLSWYVCGLDWIAAQRDPADPDRQLIEVVNMSVAKSGTDDRNCGLTNNDVLHRAICRLTATGVTVIAAAANESTYASLFVPAAYDEVITVSALADTDGKPGGLGPSSVCGSANRDDTFATFSNYGFDVDIMAPGKCIRSDLPNNTTGVMSGTSMAAPHVTGAVALYKASRAWATTAETLAALLDLGTFDYDTSTDPDGRADVLLDVTRLGPYGQFSMSFGRSSTTGAPGGSVTIPVTVNRSITHVERVTLTAAGPAGFDLALNQSSVFGTNGVFATLSVGIPEAAVHGSYTLTVIGTEHGRVRQATTQLVVEPQEATGAPFTPIDPTRLLDTRTGTGLGGMFNSRVPRNLQVTGRGGIPSNAVAVTGNVTIVGQTSAGYVSVGPTISATPTTSVLNVPIGDTRAAGVTVALSSTGTLGLVWMGGTSAKAHLIFDVTGYFVVGASGLTFRGVTPARVLDTRLGTGLGSTFRTGVVRTLPVAGQAGIPANAVAVTANLTIIGQSSNGFVSVGPTMTSVPATSTLNAPKGDVRANSTTVRLSESGTLDLVWTGAPRSTTQLILDITGYFTASTSGALFHAVTPARIVDSRFGTGLAGLLVTKTVRVFIAAGLGPVPVDAVALTGTLTITGQTSAGYLSVGPVMSSSPSTSTLNAPVNDNRANGFVNLVGPDERLEIVWVGGRSSRTHAIVDVTGYYR